MAKHINQSIRYQDRHTILRRKIYGQNIACKRMIPFHNQEGFDPFQFEKVLLVLTDQG